jgi:Zn finger protein HypA/HybF involved in hydrogenase expression
MEEKPQEDESEASKIVEEAGDNDVNVTPIVAAGGVSAGEESVEDEGEAEENDISNKQWDVTCPTCSKPVKTKVGSLYHRCPFCQNVFELQKQTAMVQKEEK